MPLVISLPFLLFAGFIGGFYGVSVSGGSLITIPALIFTGLPIQFVIATSRFAWVWGELIGVLGFRKHVKFDRTFALLCGFIGSAGAFAGSRVVLSLNEHILNIVVAVLLVGVAFFLLKSKKWGEGSETLPRRKKILMLLVMPFIGFYAGFFGPAHGVFSLMILTGSGLGFYQSAATTRIIGFMIAVTAALSFLQAGAIEWPQSIALAVGLVCGGWMGVRFSIRRGTAFIRWLLIVVAIASAAQLLWKVL